MNHATLLVLFHIMSAALWFGGPLLASSALRRGLEGSRETFEATASVAYRGVLFGIVGVLLTLITGTVLIFVQFGGFGGAGPRFHTALTVVLVAALSMIFLMRPSVAKMLAAAKDADWTAEKSARFRGRVAAAGGINHLLWIVALVMMYLT